MNLIDSQSQSVISLDGRLRLESAMLWSTSQRIFVSVDSAGFLNLNLKMTYLLQMLQLLIE